MTASSRKLLRKQLGLRRIVYREDDRRADPRPCPPWCWIASQTDTDYEHEVDWNHPTAFTHTHEPTPMVLASMYPADADREVGPNKRRLRTATWEPHLEQVGQARPTIKVYLRHWPKGEHKFEMRMILSIDDALDLIKALTYLTIVARGEAIEKVEQA